MLSAMKFQVILWGMAQLLKFSAWRHPVFKARLKERNLVAQLKARDEDIGRWYAIRDGKVTSGHGSTLAPNSEPPHSHRFRAPSHARRPATQMRTATVTRRRRARTSRSSETSSMR